MYSSTAKQSEQTEAELQTTSYPFFSLCCTSIPVYVLPFLSLRNRCTLELTKAIINNSSLEVEKTFYTKTKTCSKKVFTPTYRLKSGELIIIIYLEEMWVKI